jgi:hypothetical protein
MPEDGVHLCTVFMQGVAVLEGLSVAKLRKKVHLVSACLTLSVSTLMDCFSSRLRSTFSFSRLSPNNVLV